MKVIRWTGLFLLLILLMVGCGKEQASADETSEGDKAQETQIPLDIISEVAGAVSEQQKKSMMDDEQQKNYKVLLDGCPDQDAVYYLYDFTGDGSPELIMGNGTMSVYSYSSGSVMTIGTLMIKEAYLSTQYGLLAYYVNDGIYELRQYQYDGEMVVEKVLASASNLEDYDAQAEVYMASADELQAFALTDRTPFE